MALFEFIEIVGTSIDAVGVAVIAIGAPIPAAGAVVRLTRSETAYRPFQERRRTSAPTSPATRFVDPAGADVPGGRRHHPHARRHPRAEDLRGAGGIVLIRTYLSYSLQLEVTGYWTWRGAGMGQGNQAQLARAAQ